MAIVIDATNLLLGRLASFAAKKAMAGEQVIIVNAEKAVVSGKRESILEKYKWKREVGDIYKGPFFPRMPDRLVRRTIRGMLPYSKAKGRAALKRVRVYIGTPEEIKGKPADIKKEASTSRLKDQKFIRIEEISRWLGAEW